MKKKLFAVIIFVTLILNMFQLGIVKAQTSTYSQTPSASIRFTSPSNYFIPTSLTNHSYSATDTFQMPSGTTVSIDPGITATIQNLDGIGSLNILGSGTLNVTDTTSSDASALSATGTLSIGDSGNPVVVNASGAVKGIDASTININNSNTTATGSTTGINAANSININGGSQVTGTETDYISSGGNVKYGISGGNITIDGANTNVTAIADAATGGGNHALNATGTLDVTGTAILNASAIGYTGNGISAIGAINVDNAQIIAYGGWFGIQSVGTPLNIKNGAQVDATGGNNVNNTTPTAINASAVNLTGANSKVVATKKNSKSPPTLKAAIQANITTDDSSQTVTENYKNNTSTDAVAIEDNFMGTFKNIADFTNFTWPTSLQAASVNKLQAVSTKDSLISEVNASSTSDSTIGSVGATHIIDFYANIATKHTINADVSLKGKVYFDSNSPDIADSISDFALASGGNSHTLTAVPTTGYVFSSWSVSGYTGALTIVSPANNATPAFKMPDMDGVKLTANFAAKTNQSVDLTYNGATSGNTLVQITGLTTDTTKLTTLPKPIKNGYDFKGWYPNADFSGTEYTNTSIYDVELAGTGNLYAKFTAKSNQSVNLNYNGATGGNSLSQITGLTTDTTKLTTLPTPNKNGYDFKGWYPNADFSGTEYTNISIYDGELAGTGNLYAKFTPKANQSVILNYNGATGGNSLSQITGLTTDTTKLTTLPTPIKDGYDFNGWYPNADFSGKKYTSGSTYDVELAGTGNLYASWTLTPIPGTDTNESVSGVVNGTSVNSKLLNNLPNAGSMESIYIGIVLILAGSSIFVVRKKLLIERKKN